LKQDLPCLFVIQVYFWSNLSALASLHFGIGYQLKPKVSLQLSGRLLVFSFQDCLYLGFALAVGA
jgi:hypothetical protein